MSETAKPKILLAVSNIAVGGGAEKVAVALAGQLQAAGHDVVLLTFYTAATEHSFAGTRVSRHEVTPASLFGKLPRALARIFFIKRVCREHQIDAVISFLEESNYYCLLSKVLLQNPVPMIVSVRLDPRFYNRVYQFLIRHLYPRAVAVVAVTKYVEKVLQETFGLTNTTTIYNPIDQARIDAARQEPLPEPWATTIGSGKTIVSIGRLTKQKGQWHLIRAFSHVAATDPEAKLIILGDGEYKAQLETLIADCGLGDRVFLAGRHTNVYPFLDHAALFVFSSLWEGMPNTVLEALACQVPIVAADCDSGPREIIAPELSLEESVSYPYEATYGTLVAPFDPAPAPIWAAPSGVPLTPEETALAAAMARALEAAPRPALAATDHRFDPKSITSAWQTLVMG